MTYNKAARQHELDGRSAGHPAGSGAPEDPPGNNATPGAGHRPQGGQILALHPGGAPRLRREKRKRQRRNRYGLKADARGTWHCDFYVGTRPNSRRIQRSCGTEVRAQAEEWCATLAQNAWRESRLGETPPVGWNEAVLAWFAAKERDKKRDLANDRDKALLFQKHLAGQQLAAITKDRLDEILEHAQDENEWTNSTRNRYRSFVVGVLNFAHRKGWLATVPKPEKLTEQTPPPRPLERDEETRLLPELPLHLKRAVAFSILSGQRQSNVTGLRWYEQRHDEHGVLQPHVAADLSMIYVPPLHSKNGKWLFAPLNAAAQKILRAARKCREHGHELYCFTYRGEPMWNPANTAWLKALKRATVKHFKWHGLRSTFVTRHLERGTPLEVVQRLGCWSSLAVLQKHYAHLARSHLDRFAGNVGLAT